jgi:YVTN family beta-propeller protein
MPIRRSRALRRRDAQRLLLVFGSLFMLSGRMAVGAPETPAVIARIPVGASPHGIAVTLDGRQLYVTHFDGRSVSVIDTVTLRVSDTIPVEAGPVNVVLSSDGLRAFVTNEISGTLSVISTPNRRLVKRLALARRPHGLALSPDGSRLYVCNLGSNVVSVVDTLALRVLGEVGVGDTPDSPAVTPDGREVWVTDYDHDGAGTLSIIDTQSLRRAGTVAVGEHPHGIQISPDGSRVYASMEGDDEVLAVDTATRQVVGHYATGGGPHGLALFPDGSTLWTGDLDSHTTTLIDAQSGAQLGQLVLGDHAEPHVIAFSPDGRRAYISNFFAQEVIVVATGRSLPTAPSLRLSRASLMGGNSLTGVLYLDAPAPAGPSLMVTLASTNPAVTVPRRIRIGPGETRAIFRIATAEVRAPTDVTLSGTVNGATVTARLTLLPALAELAIVRFNWLAPRVMIGRVTLNGEAPPGGIRVDLSSSHPSIIKVPANVIVPAGSTSVDFAAQVSFSARFDYVVTLTASRGSVTKSVVLAYF